MLLLVSQRKTIRNASGRASISSNQTEYGVILCQNLRKLVNSRNSDQIDQNLSEKTCLLKLQHEVILSF